MPDQPDPTDLTRWHTGRLLTAAARLIEHTFDSDIAGLGVTHAGVRVLDVLSTGPLTQHELAVRCQVQDQTMSRTLDGLERDGLVVRHRDPGDRRRMVVARTEQGAIVIERARDVAATRLPLDDEADPDDIAATRRVLIDIIKRYSPTPP